MSARSFEIRYVDVFTERPLLGNPVAVVLGAEGLDDATMQAVARWTNLSETTFVLDSAVADYRVRIFSTVGEFPFAGHPTIGTAHAVREAGLVAPGDGPAAATMECEAGLVPIVWNADGTITATVPVSRVVGPGSGVTELGDLLGGEVSEPVLVIDTGPHWMVAAIGSAAQVMAAEPDGDRLAAMCGAAKASGLTIYGFGPEGGGAVEVRSFAPGDGVPRIPSVAAATPRWPATWRPPEPWRESVGATRPARVGPWAATDGWRCRSPRTVRRSPSADRR